MEMKMMERWLVRTLFLLAAAMAALQALGLDDLTSLLFLLTFPLTVILWLRTVRKNLTGNDIFVMVTAALAAGCVLADCALSGGQLSFGYLKKLTMFVMTLLFFQAAHRLKPDAGLKRFVTVAAVGLSTVFLLMFLLRKTQMYEIDGVKSRYLTFGFSNPNLATMFLTMLCMLLFCRARETGKMRYSLWAVAMAFFVVLTGARNAYLALAVFALLWIGLGRKKPVRLRWVSLWPWLPMVFAGVYMALVYLPPVQQLLEDFAWEGKGLDSRASVWQQAFEAIAGSPLIGSYWAISEGTGVSQMHNSHLDMAASYGLPVLILACVLLQRWLRGGRNDYIFGFVGALMLGFGEAAVFSGGLGIYIFAGVLLLLAKEEENENRVCQ